MELYSDLVVHIYKKIYILPITTTATVNITQQFAGYINLSTCIISISHNATIYYEHTESCG